jgi:hypothetical protein
MQAALSTGVAQGNRHLYAATRDRLLVIDRGARPKGIATGLPIAHFAAGGDRVCITSSGEPHWLQCLAEDTLTEVWRAPLPKDASGYALTVADGAVFVTTWDRQLGFDLASGRRLWATNEFNNLAYVIPAGPLFLTQGSTFVPEWRDVRTGEVVSTYPSDRTSLRRPVRAGDRLLFEVSDIPGADTTTWTNGEGLRLLQIPGQVRLRLTPPSARR